jgi:hypothetical protein
MERTMDKIKADDITEALKLRERDLRARMLVDSAVSVAMHELRDEEPNDPRDCREFAYRVATLAASTLISGIYIGDEEIRALREERDRLKEMALHYAQSVPPRFVAVPDLGTQDRRDIGEE